MPWCVVVGCSNNTFSVVATAHFPKNREQGVSFYNFPKDENLQKK